MDFDDRVVDVEQRVPVIAGTSGRVGLAQQPGEPSQHDQEPRGDRVELADVTEGERPQERSQRRRGVGAGEDPPHPAVPKQNHVVDRVRAGDHPADQRGDLQPRVRALVGRDGEVLIGQVPKPCGVVKSQHRDQATGRHEIRIVERHRRPTKCVRESHLRDALRCRSNRCLKNSDSPATQGHSRVTARSPDPPHRWIEA